MDWIEVAKVGFIATESAMRFDFQGRTFAIYRSPDDRYFATDGLCTHERVHLCERDVIDDTIECRMHSGLFNGQTGEALGAAVCINLSTYRTKVENGRVFMALG